MSRPLMSQDYILIGAILFVIFSCVVFLIWSYPGKRTRRVRHARFALPAGQDFREMYSPDRRPEAREDSLELHETAGVDRDDRVSAGAKD